MRPLVWLCLVGMGLGMQAQADPPAAPAPLPRIVLTLANPVLPPGLPGSSTTHYGAGGYTLGQAAHALARRIARQYDLKEVASWPIQVLGVHCVVYELKPGEDVEELLMRLKMDTRVVLVQPLQEFHTLSGQAQVAAYNDPLFDLQTNLTELDIARAHQRARGEGVRIGLIDTAVDTRHPDLAGRIAGIHSFVATPAHPPAGSRHGTAMAGLIAAVANNRIGIVGVAPLARLEVFEACWQLRPDSDDAVCNTFTLARALAAALDTRVPLINLSLAGPNDPLLTALVRAGQKQGVTFVGASAQPSAGFPGNIPGVIVAGSVGHGSWPAQLTAPAEHVFTLRPGGEYDFESGTSVATAEVSGAVALLMSASRSHLTTQAITSLLEGTPQPVSTSPASPLPALNINTALEHLDDAQSDLHVVAETR